MKKKLLFSLLILLIIPCAFIFAACNNGDKSQKYNISFIVDEQVYETVETSGNETILLPTDPTKENFSFCGWYYDDETFQNKFLAADFANKTLSSNISVYAKWISVTQRMIYYQLDDGTNHPLNPTTLPSNQEFTLLEPTRDYFNFGGWYTDFTFETPITYIAQSAEQEIEVIAKWVLQEKYQPFRIISRSMEPTLSDGDWAIVEQTSDDSLSIGDIIAFKYNNSNNTVLHRITAKHEEDGQIKYKTKGDANSSEDVGFLTIEDILGKYVASAPLLPLSYRNTITSNGLHFYDFAKTRIDEYLSFKSSLVVPEGITAIETRAFENVSHLKNITFPTSLEYIGEKAFINCTNLQTIIIPNNVTELSISCFEGCTSLESVIVGTSVEYIKDFAFKNCTNLSEVSLPSSLKDIGDSIFENTKWLTANTKETLAIIQSYDNESVKFLIKATSKNNSPISVSEDDLQGVKLFEDYAFRGVELTSIVLPECVESISLAESINAKNILVYSKFTSKPENFPSSILVGEYSTIPIYWYSENESKFGYWRYVNEIPTLWEYYPENIAFDYNQDLDNNGEIEAYSDFQLTITTTTANITQKEVTISLEGDCSETQSGKLTDGVITIPKTVKIGQSFWVSAAKSYNPIKVFGGNSTIIATSENKLIAPIKLNITVIATDASGIRYIFEDGVFVDIETRAYTTSMQMDANVLKTMSQTLESYDFDYLNSMGKLEQDYTFNNTTMGDDEIYKLSTNGNFDKGQVLQEFSFTFTEDEPTFFIVTKITNKETDCSVFVNYSDYGLNILTFPDNINYRVPPNQIEILPESETYIVVGMSIDNLSVATDSNFVLPIVVTK